MISVKQVHELLEVTSEVLHQNIYIFLLLPIMVFIVLYLNRLLSRKSGLPPSPPKLPFIGNLHQLGPLMHHSFRDLSKTYGPIMLLHLGQSPILIVSSTDVARDILTNVKFADRPFIKAARVFFYKSTSLSATPHGDYWRRLRKIGVQNLLNVSNVEALKYVREEEIEVMMEKLLEACSLKTQINLTEMILSFTNNLACRSALGAKSEDGTKFGKLAHEALSLFLTFNFEDLFPSIKWMDTLTGLDWRFKKVFEEVDAFFDKIIEEHLSKSKFDDSKKDFLDELLEVQVENNLSTDNIKALIMDIFLGGTDSTAITIDWAMAELIRNPNAMRKAQEEVRRVVGMKSNVQEEDIPGMEYLKLVVKETLRLHPALPTLVPRYTSEVTKLNGYTIPPNTTVMINVWSIQRDPLIWDRPEEFIPERFSNNSIEFKGQFYEFIPFGSGRRICPGMRFAISAAELVLAKLLFSYDWRLPDGVNEVDMTEIYGATVGRKTALRLIPELHCSV